MGSSHDRAGTAEGIEADENMAQRLKAVAETDSVEVTLASIRRLIEEQQSIGVARYLNAPLSEIRDELLPIVTKAASEVLDFVESLLDQYESLTASQVIALAGECQVREGNTPLPAVEIADYCFVSISVLRSGLKRLARAPKLSSAVAMLRICDGAHRESVEALMALDASLSKQLGVATLPDLESALQGTLRLRRALQKFWKGVLSNGDSKERCVVKSLLSVGCSIARLEGRPEIEDMRLSDRLSLREVQSRIRQWLSIKNGDPLDGKRLLEDAVGFAVLLRKVNSRGELVEHDRQLLSQIAEMLSALEPNQFDPQMVREQLSPLIGHSEELDRLLEGPFSEDDVRDLVLQIKQDLEGRYNGQEIMRGQA